MKLPVVEAYELQYNSDINEVINLLGPFAKDHNTQMLASYIVSQITRLKLMAEMELDVKKEKLITAEELHDLRNKLDKWLHSDIAKSVVGEQPFALIIERALVTVQNYELINEPSIQIESKGKKIKTINLNELFTILRENKFLNTLSEITLRFVEDITKSQLQFLIDCLIAYPVSFPIQLNFSECNLGAPGSKLLSEYLKSGKTAKDLCLWLYNCGIDDEGARYLAEGIKSGKTSEDLILNLDDNRISDAGVKFLSDAIQSGFAKNKLILVLEAQANTEASARHLAELIRNPKAPNGLGLSLFSLDDNVVEILADALRVGKITNFHLDIRKISSAAQLYLVNSIDKTSPEGLSVYLATSSNKLDGVLGEALTKMISEGRAPKNLRCRIFATDSTFPPNKGTQFINLLAEALAKGNAPFGLFLDFEWADFSVSEDAKLRLLNTLENGQLPPQFKLNVAFLLRDDLPFQKALADILMKSTSLSIDFRGDIPLNEGVEQKYLNIIRYCSLRNRLLWQYPEHADLIKKISTEAGYYNPAKERISPISLRSYAAHAFFSAKEVIENYEEALGILPPDIVKYIQMLESLSSQIRSEFPKRN